jgi:hypothetical protein
LAAPNNTGEVTDSKVRLNAVSNPETLPPGRHARPTFDSVTLPAVYLSRSARLGRTALVAFYTPPDTKGP